MAIGAKADATLKLAPERSQTAVITMMVLTGMCLGGVALFAWYEKPVWIPGSFALLFTLLSVWMWSRSHAQEADATTLSVRPGQFDLQAPASSFSHGESFKRLVELVHAVRPPLPIPSGLVDDNLEPIAGSEEQARSAVEAVNAQLEQAQRRALENLRPNSGSVLVEPISPSGT